MKNLIHEREDKLETMPNRSNVEWRHRHQNRQHFWGDAYPYNKVNRFLRNNVGKPWDEVSSKFHNLDWVPKSMRNLEHIKRHVITDTFIKNGKVVHIGNRCSGEVSVDAHCKDQFYVHPTTKRLCVNDPPRPDRALDRTMKILGEFHQLLKLDGTWYEVKAQPTKPDDGLVNINGLYYEEANVEPVLRYDRFGRKLKDIAPADGRKYKIHDGKLYIPASPRYKSYGTQPLGPRDRIIEEQDGKPRWMRYNGVTYDNFKITLKRQLTSDQLKKHGLRNDPKPLFGPRCKKCGGIVGKDCLIHYCRICRKPNKDCKCLTW